MKKNYFCKPQILLVRDADGRTENNIKQRKKWIFSLLPSKTSKPVVGVVEWMPDISSEK